jgi:transcriptional regulator with XRE-family HTH domain
MAREARGLDQAGVAEMVGLRTKAAISDYERGVTEVPQWRLRRFAEIYGWPLVLFTEPDPTAEEQARERIALLARAAIRLAHLDEDLEPEPDPGAGGSQGERPSTRIA